ncbi:MAG: aldo/keto reductase [Verrucomicrobiota bacterium]
MLTVKPKIELNDGHPMPVFGYGAYRVADNTQGEAVTLAAIDAGYLHIDTASAYQNEDAIGNALAASPVAREELFITSKLWIDEQGSSETPVAIENSLRRLKTDYLDLLLIHWPRDDRMAACWDAMQQAVSTKKIRSIGISTFTVKRLETFDRLCSGATPAVNQVEYHTFLQQKELREDCRKRGIALSGYCPLARALRLDDPVLVAIAKRHGKTPAQVMIRWSLQQDAPTIPKSSTPARIESNAAIFDFELDGADLQKIDTLDNTFEANAWRPNHEVFY